MKKFKRIGRNEVKVIYDLLPVAENAQYVANEIQVSLSAFLKHLKTYRVLNETSTSNKCGHKYNCKINDLCESCNYKKKQTIGCRVCSMNCNTLCDEFTMVPDCKRIKKFPYVCNGCEQIKTCKRNHYHYDYDDVWEKIVENRTVPRENVRATDEELVRLSSLLAPLILEKKQSLSQIFCANKDIIGWSYQTILNLINENKIPGISNIDLPKRVKYPLKNKNPRKTAVELSFIKERCYEKFIEFITENPGIEVVEMDTVLSSKDGSKCILTLLFRKSNFMLGFLLEEQSSKCVERLFHRIQKVVGLEIYRKTFSCILTDRGHEFYNPLAIEFARETGEKVANVFYCDPYASNQKGKIEKNHVELRKVFPKPTNFNKFTQEHIDLALSHINSEPRRCLNGDCPGEIATAFIQKEIMDLIHFRLVPANEVELSPKLFE